MEFVSAYIVEILLSFLVLSIGGIGSYQMYHNKKSDNDDDKISKQMNIDRQESDDKQIRILDRMESNHAAFLELHNYSVRQLSDLSIELTKTHTELHSTNESLSKLADTVTFVIREEIPKMKSDLHTLQINQAACPARALAEKEKSKDVDD